MIIALAAHVATTAAITGGHVVIAAHFASAARLTRRLFAIFAACTRRHGHLKIGTGLGCCAHHWPCRDGFVFGGAAVLCPSEFPVGKRCRYNPGTPLEPFLSSTARF